MNILFFLTPKAMCSYIDADATFRQAMERMENSGYTALPVLDADGSYVGVVTEGDLLWALKSICVMDMRQTEAHFIRDILPRRVIHPVKVDTRGGSGLRRRRAELRSCHRRQERLHRHRHPKPHPALLSGAVFRAYTKNFLSMFNRRRSWRYS